MIQICKYKVLWSNEHNSGELPDTYIGMETALTAAREWEAEMIAIDDDPEEAAREYHWEVIRIQPPRPPTDGCAFRRLHDDRNPA